MAMCYQRRRFLTAAAWFGALAHGPAALADTTSSRVTLARDLPWSQLSPPGWRPQALLDRLGVADLVDEDPRAKAILAEVHTAWQKAPPVSHVPKGRVRLTGFAVMLDDGQAPVRQVLLVPYYGACIHSPPPPANQAVLVSLDRDLPRNMYQFPIWITGEVQVKTGSTRHGKVLYRMEDAQWERYPWPRHPLPVYRLPS